MTKTTKTATKAKAQSKAKTAKAPKAVKEPKAKEPTRHDQLTEMLRRPEGVTIAQVQEAFNILPHSARAQISMLGKKLGTKIDASRPAKGEPLVYRLASPTTATVQGAFGRLRRTQQPCGRAGRAGARLVRLTRDFRPLLRVERLRMSVHKSAESDPSRTLNIRAVNPMGVHGWAP